MINKIIKEITTIYSETGSLEGTYGLFLELKHNLEDLEKENQELRGKNFDLSISNVHLRNEIFYLKDKYQTTIEILKETLEVFVNKNEYNTPYIKCWQQSSGLTQQEYELLKEVLE